MVIIATITAPPRLINPCLHSEFVRRALVVLLAAALFANFAEGLYTPVYAAYVENVGGNLADAGLSWSVNLIVFGLVAMFFSRVESGSRAKIGYLVAGYALSALATGLFILVSEPWMLYAVQLLRGISWAMLSPVWDSFFSLLIDKREATVEWGYYEGGWSIAMGIGSAIGGILVDALGFAPMFILSALVNALSALLVVLFRSELSISYR